ARPLLAPTLNLVKVHHNGEKVRLREDLHPNGSFGELAIERTDYVADLVTGQLTGVQWTDSHGLPFSNGFDLAFEYDARTLKTCRASGCSNQLGVSSLLVLVSPQAANSPPKGYVVIVRQGAGNVQSSRLLAPSGSGSLDWRDVRDFQKKFVSRGMLRE